MSKSLADILNEMSQPKKKIIKESAEYDQWKKDVRASYPKAVFDKEGDEYINTATLDGVEIASFESGEGYVAPVDSDVEGKVAPVEDDSFEFDTDEDDLDEAKKSDTEEDDKEKVKEVKQDATADDEAESDDLDISGDDEATEKAKESMGDDEDDADADFDLSDFADDTEDTDDKAAIDSDDIDAIAATSDKEDSKEEKEDDSEVTVVVVSPDHDLESDEDKEKKTKKEEFSMDEHMTALLQGETLSEEFKEKTRTIFEAALKSALKEHKQKVEAKLLEQFNKKYKAVKESVKAKAAKSSQLAEQALIQSVDGFLTTEAKKWSRDNRVVLEKNIRADLAEGFIDGLKTLFVESYIEVPEEKFDVIAAQGETIKQLEESLAKQKSASTKLLRQNSKLERASIMSECMADLTDTQKVKMEKLAESIEYVTGTDFAKQMTLIKESYFTKQPVPNIARKQLIEEVEIEIEATNKVMTRQEKLAEQITKMHVG